MPVLTRMRGFRRDGEDERLRVAGCGESNQMLSNPWPPQLLQRAEGSCRPKAFPPWALASRPVPRLDVCEQSGGEGEKVREYLERRP